MATLANVISDVRIELDDSTSSRWNDTQLLALVCKAIRRANHILFKYDVDFGMATHTFNSVVSQSSYALPADYMTSMGLYRTSDGFRLEQVNHDRWSQSTNIPASVIWIVMNDLLYIGGTPSLVEGFTFHYWPKLDTSAYTTSTTMPWSSRLDDIIAEYAALRAKNIDEMDLSEDATLLQDLENKILTTYSSGGLPQFVRGFV